MKPGCWEILHERKLVGYLTDPSEKTIVDFVDCARYTVVPAPGNEALLFDPEAWSPKVSDKNAEYVFQFRHSKTGEVVSDQAANGSKEQIAKELANHKVVLIRLRTAAEHGSHIDALALKWFGVPQPGGFWHELRSLPGTLTEGWREGRFEKQHPVEPVHEARPFSAWLEDVFLKDEPGSQHAMNAILTMGDAAVPFLFKLIRFGPGDLPQRTLAVEQAEAWEDSFNRQYHPDRFKQRSIALFRFLRPLAGQFAPELAPLLEPPRPWAGAAALLAAMGGEALPVLLTAARHPDAKVRCVVVRQLCNLEPPLEPALPVVLESLNDAEVSVRCESLNLLRRWLADKKLASSVEATGWFINKLSDDNVQVRYEALRNLEMLGRKMDLTPAIPHLHHLQNDDDPSIKTRAWMLEGLIEKGFYKPDPQS